MLAQQTTSPSGSNASASGANGQQAAQLQEVEVTGSRIKRTTDFNTPTPTTVIDTETMSNLGIVNVGQALAVIPANVSSVTPLTTGYSDFYTGQYIPDLRGLNGFFTSRTLTLIDGERAVSSNTEDSFDLNFVPQILVQRIDTVTGGASAAYGSGAVAGVVNIILDRTLEGGKLDADVYDTHYNDARSTHVAAAYGHGLFDDRLHFVVGAEYQKSDGARCMDSGRPWCTSNFGPYPIPGSYSPEDVGLDTLGANLRTDVVSPYGALAAASYNPAAFGYVGSPSSPLYQASPDGLGLIPYSGNNAAFGGDATAPGGDGVPSNEYTNLTTPVTRGVITGLLTAKITDSIEGKVDFNWGKVEANNPDDGLNFTYGAVGLDNPFLPAGTLAALSPTTCTFQPTTFEYSQCGIYLGKDWNSQIPNSEYNNTTLKRVVLGLDGKIGDSSWSWDGYYEYGLSTNQNGEPTEFHSIEESMALDSVSVNGTPECRITAALNANGGNIEAAMNELTGFGAGSAYAAYPGGLFQLPAYLEDYALTGASAVIPPSPVTGLTPLQTDALLAQNCVPLNPFGNQPLSAAVANYISGPLALDLRQTQTVLAANASGNFFSGIGAGPWSMAVGYEWRQEELRLWFAQCPPGALSGAAETLCLAETTDFALQLGNPYAGATDVNEGYVEFNLPLLKDAPWAHLLEVDLAGRESAYNNTAIYGIGITPGSTNSETFPTWKTSIIFDPIQGIRFRATESRDERAPDPRDLTYSQTFVAGSLYGSCGAYANPSAGTVPCNIDLAGNIDLKPESSNTTTAGIVLTPPQLPGFEASADWFHIHLINGINGGSIIIAEEQCATGHGASACPGIVFNPYSYEASTGAPCSSGVSGPLFPGASGVNCTGVATLTGAAAYQTGLAPNLLDMVAPAFNGAFYDERGVDFSLNYVMALPDGSTIAARALTTFTDEEAYQNYAGGPVENALGETSLQFLTDYQSAPRWQGNMSVTWAKGAFSLTPNVRWLGQMALNNQGLACTQTELNTSTNPCYWVYHAYINPNGAPDSAAQSYLKSQYEALLPIGLANHVPAYFVFGLNATYTFDNVLKGLQIWAQVNNLFNKAPPFTDATTSQPVFYDELGQAYQIGFRLNF